MCVEEDPPEECMLEVGNASRSRSNGRKGKQKGLAMDTGGPRDGRCPKKTKEQATSSVGTQESMNYTAREKPEKPKASVFVEWAVKQQTLALCVVRFRHSIYNSRFFLMCDS